MLKLLLPYLGNYRKYALLAPLLVVLEVGCELVLPLVMANIVDVGIATGDLDYILRQGTLMLLLAGAAMALGVGAARCAAIGSQGFGANLRTGIFGQIQAFAFADIDRFSSASLITRMTSDVNAITLMLAMSLRMLTRAPITLLAALAVTMSISFRLAVVLLIVIPVMGAAVYLLMRACMRLFEVVQGRLDSLNSTVQENLVGVRVVKAFVRARFETEKFQRTNDSLTEASLRVGLRIIALIPIMMVGLNVATVVVLWTGGQMVMGGALGVGELSSFITYIGQVLMSVIMVAMALLQFSRAQACAHRIRQVLETVPAITESGRAEKLPPARGRVEFQNVSFRYREGSGEDVLRQINLVVEPGEFVAVMGGTGVGKSSLVNLIPRFYDVTQGRVLLDGLDVRAYPLESLRRRIGMVLQKNVLFSGTVRDNLRWGREDATDEELERAARDAQAYDFISALPDGFDTWLEQGGTNVSGGQRQRLCIARALLKAPAVLILDDSTSALDTATEARVRAALREHWRETTLFLVAQRISSVEHADKIIVLEDDHIAAMGNHAELLQSSPIYREIFRSQQEGAAG